MPDDSARLLLPFMLANQSQKHVTHNEALAMLDALVQMAVLDKDLSAPPASPAEGDAYIVAAGASGLWGGWSGDVAVFSGGAWLRLSAGSGWRAFVIDEQAMYVRIGSEWQEPTPRSRNLPGVGVNADYDATDRLVVAALATLLTHDGAGHQLKINKASAGDTASLLFQTDWSGRAEMGAAGNDDFSVKVSPDGSAWHVALVADRATGKVTCPSGLEVTGLLTGTAVTQSREDTAVGRLLKTGDGGWLLGPGVARSITDLFVDGRIAGVGRTTGATMNLPAGVSGSFGMITIRAGSASAGIILYDGTTLHSLRLADAGSVSEVARYLNTLNTTVDANGFVKEASPIVRLFADHIEEPVDTVAAKLTRNGTGKYTLSNVPPLATLGWQIEVPQDHNGNRLVFVNTAYDAGSETLTVSTSRPTWNGSQGVWEAGDPLDIPEGRWVDLRFWKDPELEAGPDEE